MGKKVYIILSRKKNQEYGLMGVGSSTVKDSKCIHLA